MKIALVNLTKIADYATESSYQADMDFLNENNISYVDYCSGRSDFENLLKGFHDALENPEVDIIWFVQGGTSLIKFIPSINWSLVEKTKKKYLGISDFTHFSSKAIDLGSECYYGGSLAKITKYWKTKEDRQHIVDFIKSGMCNMRAQQIFPSTKESDFLGESILGGHMIISTFMMSQSQPKLNNSFLFLEHHYIPGESLLDLEFWLDQVKYLIKDNQPKGFILGHSILFDKQNNILDFNELNRFLTEKLKIFNKPIYQIDHFKNLVKLSK